MTESDALEPSPADEPDIQRVAVHAFLERARKRLAEGEHDPLDPDPWMALYLDESFPIALETKAALLTDGSSWSRQFLLPFIRPLARGSMVLIQVLKFFVPNALSASKFMHWSIWRGLQWFVRPEANYIILRHFHIGSEVLQFIADNLPGVELELSPIRPTRLRDVCDEIFLNHDLNLFNFIIRVGKARRTQNVELPEPAQLDFSAISDEPFAIEELPDRWCNFLDVESAIEIYTPMYQLFLTDRDFWRACNSLQLDETIGLYVAALIRNPTHMSLVNNKHPMVPLSTLRAGYRLMLHGLASEGLHEMLRRYKRAQREGKLEEMLASPRIPSS